MHVGYSIFDLNIKGPRRGHIIKANQLQILVKPNYASGLTLHKTQVCAGPSLVQDVGVRGSLCLHPASTLCFPSGQICLSGAEGTDLEQEKEGLCVASVLASVMGFSSPDYAPILPSPICAVGEGSEVWTGD